MKKLNRRSFSKKAATLAAATSLLGTQAFSRSKTASSANRSDIDYVIVGSGAGGGPLACNLAIHGFKVLVLEAGQKDTSNYVNEVPAFSAQCSEDPNFSWHYFVKHFTNGNEADSKYVPGKGIFYPRGATIGGSTINNAMITVYPHDSDFEYIARITGDNSWNSKNMRKYLAILEKSYYLNYYHAKAEGHGTNGWLPTRYPDLLGTGSQDPYLIKIILANIFHNKKSLWDAIFKKHLFNPSSRYFASGGTGPILVPQNTHPVSGKRHAVREYLLETQRNYSNNLFIETNALASKIIIKDKKAIGVEYYSGENLYGADPHYKSSNKFNLKSIYAKREIIVAAGAFNSPQLLKLSGIGAKRELNKKGIPLVHHLPGVGRNLQDRYEIGITYKFKRDIIRHASLQPNDPYFRQFYRDGTGPYTSNGIAAANIIKSSNHLKDPDIFNFALLGSFKGYYPNYSKDIRRDKSILTWAILKGHTDSNYGTVKLSSNNPRDTPIINFKNFHNGSNLYSQDMNAMVHAVKNIRNLMRNWNIRWHIKKEVWPGNNIRSDYQIRDFVKKEAWGHHASCTNKIGANNDKFAVLDSKFRVRGIQNLRVVDASVFPKIPGFFISVPIYLISEKATDDILHAAGTSRKSNQSLFCFFKNRTENKKLEKQSHVDQIIKCYPNPFTENITFEFKGNADIKEVSLLMMDLQGKIVINKVVTLENNAFNLDVNHLSIGNYIYLIRANNFEKKGRLIKN